MSKYDSAIVNLTKAIEINPDYAQAYFIRGTIYYQQRKLDLALVDYDRAVEINPNFAEAYYNRGILYHEQRKNDLAAIDLENSKELYSRQGNMTSVDQVNNMLEHITSR